MNNNFKVNEKEFHSDSTLVSRIVGSENALSHAQNKVNQSLGKTSSLSKNMILRLPTFHFEELELNKMLGLGSFCEVYEVVSMEVLHKSQNGIKMWSKSLSEFDEDCSETETMGSFALSEELQLNTEKKAIAKNCKRSGDARFAIKYLRPEVVRDSSLCAMGAADLAMEVMMLSNLNHPHIIRICGVSAFDFDKIGSLKGYFLLLDRLYDTVEQKLPKWKKELPRWGLQHKKTQNFHLAQRLVAAHGLASAFEYLHSRKIIYRDLKAQNVGFDVRGDIKLFDFGLARKLKVENKTVDGNYKLTKNTGTRRYMSPEVALGETYNLSADVYSYAILLWEICALKRAFKGYSYEEHQNKVLLGNTRPSIKSSWPPSLKLLLRSMWSENSCQRPDFESILHVIEKIASKHIDETKYISCHQRFSFYRLSGTM